jgi:hypothetical protein
MNLNAFRPRPLTRRSFAEAVLIGAAGLPLIGPQISRAQDKSDDDNRTKVRDVVAIPRESHIGE